MQFVSLLALGFCCVAAVDINIFNNCPFPVWPGFQGNPLPANGGFSLAAYQAQVITVPDGWTAGRIWARTGCDSSMNCATGFCGNNVECGGNGGQPPVSLAEFTLNGAGGQDYYDVSLVDGYNIPVLIDVVAGTFNTNGGQYDCKRAGGCFQDVNAECPSDLAVVVNGQASHGERRAQTVACKSSCLAFNTDQYCCRGAYGTPQTCNTNDWAVNSAAIFKSACPAAYSYAYDDGTSTFTCRGNGTPSPSYQVQFC